MPSWTHGDPKTSGSTVVEEYGIFRHCTRLVAERFAPPFTEAARDAQTATEPLKKEHVMGVWQKIARRAFGQKITSGVFGEYR